VQVCCLGDYATFGNAITWWDTDMSSPTTARVLASLQGPAAVLGWGTDESSTVVAASQYGGFVHASDWARDLSVLTTFRAPVNQAAGLNVRRQSGDVLVGGQAPPVHTVCFLMTGECGAWWWVSPPSSRR